MFTGKPTFNQEKFTLLLDIASNLPGLDSADLASEAGRKGFEKREELHITVLGFRNGKKVKEALEKITDKETVTEQIVSMAEEMDWTFEPLPERYFISKDSRESIIQMVKLENMVHFFDRLNEVLNTNIEAPPAHITLYTKGVDEKSGMGGIAIYSWDAFDKLNPVQILARANGASSKDLGEPRTKQDEKIVRSFVRGEANSYGINPRPVPSQRSTGLEKYTQIILPTRPQPDTLVAIFILKKFGEELFPGIREAKIDFWQVMPVGETEESLDKKGIVLIDLGGGRFDHHAIKPQTTASDLISFHLGVSDDPALAKLIEYARRDDFYGKGTISNDPIDRAFGLSSMIAVLNKSLVTNPAKVIDLILPLIVAHYNEETKRTKELPEEFEKKLSAGEAEIFPVKQRDKKLKAVIVNSDSGSLAGYLRSQNGGRFDVVAQWLPSGHVNILTRPTKRIDLRSLAALLRLEEATASGSELEIGVRDLARFGRIKEIPEWYYDPATNSIQNGGLNPKEINPTKISRDKFRKIVELGLSEQLWSPLAQN